MTACKRFVYGFRVDPCLTHQKRTVGDIGVLMIRYAINTKLVLILLAWVLVLIGIAEFVFWLAQFTVSGAVGLVVVVGLVSSNFLRVKGAK